MKWLVVIGALGALYYFSRKGNPAQSGGTSPAPVPGGQQGSCGDGYVWIPVSPGDRYNIGDPSILAAGGYCAAAISSTDAAGGLDAGTARAASVLGRVNPLNAVTES